MKQFLIKISCTVFPLWFAIVGLVAFYHFYIVPNMQGDLGNLGKIPTKLFYERDRDLTINETLFTTITKAELIKNDTFDIVTCGDSFSQQGDYGYQNYMALKGLSIINYFPHGKLRWNPFQAAYDLIHQEFVDSANTKMLIIESVERSLVNRLLELEYNHTYMDEEDREGGTHSTNHEPLSNAKNYLSFQLGLGNENPVKHLKMKKQLFSGTRGNFLYFYCEDIAGDGFSISKDVYQQIRNSVDSLFNLASKKNIQLIILICPDKYDLFQNYVDNNPYPPKTINEDFRKIIGNRKDIVIGKEILLPYIAHGQKDMYYFDDTHWSFKSAKIIADTLTNLYKLQLTSPITRSASI